jgi:hypothetical protein
MAHAECNQCRTPPKYATLFFVESSGCERAVMGTSEYAGQGKALIQLLLRTGYAGGSHKGQSQQPITTTELL